MKHLLLLAICSLLLWPGFSACETSGGGSGSSPTSTHRPAVVVSPTGASNVNQELESITRRYYTLIAASNYAQAYTYLDAQATDPNGQVFTQQSFVQQAQLRESEAGTIVSFSVAAYTPMVIATVTRSQLGPYHAHLQMKQEGATWKILSLDRI
jgi:hypothetical protein